MENTTSPHWRDAPARKRTEATIVDLMPDAWRLVVPLPGHSVGHVNVYVFAATDGLLMVDTGWGNPAAWGIVDRLLHERDLSLEQVTRVLVTHAHPDHLGLAGEIQTQAGASVGMHAADAARIQPRFIDTVGFAALTAAWLAAAGAPPRPDAAGQPSAVAQDVVSPVAPDLIIADKQRVRHGRWSFLGLHTPGHTAGHLCFFEEISGTLLSGDHVLEQIKTSPAMRPLSVGDPVGDYLATIPRLRALPAQRVLPGHQEPYVDLGLRLDVIEGHHTSRLAETLSVLTRGPSTAWAVTSQMPRSRPWERLGTGARTSALGETYGHLVHLAALGYTEVVDEAPTRWQAKHDALERFEASQPAAPSAVSALNRPALNPTSIEGDRMSEVVTYESVEGNVAVIALNRPEAHNAINREVRGQLIAALERFDADDGARAAVITGNGESFCAGRDLKERAADNASGRQAVPGDAMSTHSLHSYPRPAKPIIAAINGNCLAGGFSIAQLCDIRIAADDARIGITEARVGLMAPFGSLLPKLIPASAALELVLVAEPVTAQRAYDFGFVNRVVPRAELLDEALLMARKIATNAPLSVQYAKELIYRSLVLDDMSQIRLTHHMYEHLLATEDAKEGPRAFAEKRAPRWTGR